MNEQTTTDLKEETDNLTNKMRNDSYRAEILELIRLCNLSRMPGKLAEFIEQNVSVEQAREILMTTLAEQTMKTEILSTLPQNSSEDLVMQAAKARKSA